MPVTLEGCRLTLPGSNLAAGVYRVTPLLGDTAPGEIEVGENIP